MSKTNSYVLRSNVGPSLGEYREKLRHKSGIRGGKRKDAIQIINSNPVRRMVSIVTVVYNGGALLEQTIKSVLEQKYNPIEYLIIDGGSVDHTLDILRKYDRDVDYWSSEPDAGISDAMNKGIAASTGEIIGILNAGDWLSEDQIKRGVEALVLSRAEFVFGDLNFHGLDGSFKFRINGDPNYARFIRNGMPALCHPTVLVKREMYEKHGLFDLRYRIAMDYEWFLRIHMNGARGVHVNGLLGHMRVGGISDTGYMRELKEVRDIAIAYGQSGLTAELKYLGKVVKTVIRRAMEAVFPRQPYHWIRRMINRRYSPDP